MTQQQKIETALDASSDYMRMAAQSLEMSGFPQTAAILREQADKNLALLLPMVRR